MIEMARLEVVMARKRLSDLLREEGQKAADQDASEAAKPNQASSAKSTDDATDNASDNTSDAEAIPVTAEVIASQAEQVGDFVSELRDASAEPDHETDGAEADSSESDNSESDNSKVARSNPSAPELTALEATITQLNADLEMARQAAQSAQAQQVALQEKVTSLEAKVAAQAEVIQQLQTEKQQVEKSQQQVEQLKAELESARTMILQLSQANAKPTTKPTAKPLPSSRAAEPELESTNTQIVVPSAKSAQPKQPSQGERPKLHQLELRKMLDHPTRPGSLPPMPSETKPAEKEKVKLSDTDVGWMD
jgi:chromosome segregation ATPase